MQVDGRPASSTNPATWTTYAAVAKHPHGVMLGDGLGCWDLDGVLDGDGLGPEAAVLLSEIGANALWIERSMSGTGLHVFVLAPESPAKVGRMTLYTRGRFIAVTGDRWSPK